MGKRETISIFGSDFETPDGTSIRDYIHVTDLADAHSRAVEYLGKHVKNLKLNLGNGEGYSVLKIIQEVERITGQTIHYIFR